MICRQSVSWLSWLWDWDPRIQPHKSQVFGLNAFLIFCWLITQFIGSTPVWLLNCIPKSWKGEFMKFHQWMPGSCEGRKGANTYLCKKYVETRVSKKILVLDFIFTGHTPENQILSLYHAQSTKCFCLSQKVLAQLTQRISSNQKNKLKDCSII